MHYLYVSQNLETLKWSTIPMLYSGLEGNKMWSVCEASCRCIKQTFPNPNSLLSFCFLKNLMKQTMTYMLGETRILVKINT